MPGPASGSGAIRVGVVADTHGLLSKALLAELEGADAIVHAGDICSESDLRTLERIAPLHICRGNNDWGFAAGMELKPMLRVSIGGLRWQICHYSEKLDPPTCDIAVCGHSHRPSMETTPYGCTIINPGSPTYPRTQMGPSCARVIIADGRIESAEIVLLGR